MSTPSAIYVDPVVISTRISAIHGEMAWRMPVPEKPSLYDIVMQGYAAICYDGNRNPRCGACVGCKKLTTHAWRIHPIGFTVAACTGECAADKVERIWTDATPDCAMFFRFRGKQALRMAFGEDAA